MQPVIAKMVIVGLASLLQSNPPFAHKALYLEKDIGLLLPCNVIVYKDGEQIFISAILPTVAVNMVDNQELAAVAVQVEAKLKQAVNSI